MFTHIEMNMDVETTVPPGDTPHLMFEDEIVSPINGQMQVNYVTFWDLMGGSRAQKAPVIVQLVQTKNCSEERILYSSSLADALEEAVSLNIQSFLVRLIWVGRSTSSQRCVLHMRTDIDTRRHKASFSHIKREIHVSDALSLPVGHSHIVTRI